MKKNLRFLLPLSLVFGLSYMSASDITITLPKVPKVPEVPKVEADVPMLKTIKEGEYKSNAEIIREATRKKEVIFSDHVAPVIVEKKDALDKVIEVGDIHNGKVSAYLHAPLMSADEVEQRLQKAGFRVIQKYKIDKKGKVISIIFSSDALIDAASKTDRGFATALHVTIDSKSALTSITNPLFVLSAFMQEDYDKSLAQETLSKIRGSFDTLKNSKEELRWSLLEHYQFMQGMPQYQDMQIIKKAPNESLIADAKESNKVLYEIPLANGATLLGVELGRRTSKFVKKIGYQNGGLLPYPILIENSEAKILDPKYYIAIMYPQLKMSQFMTIATTPGAISKDIDKIFR